MNILESLQIELEKTGLPVSYNHFIDNVDVPFIIFFITQSKHVTTDFEVKRKRYVVSIELFTSKKDMNAEKTLEDVFDFIPVIYSTEYQYDYEEDLFVASYEIIIDEEMFI